MSTGGRVQLVDVAGSRRCAGRSPVLHLKRDGRAQAMRVGGTPAHVRQRAAAPRGPSLRLTRVCGRRAPAATVCVVLCVRSPGALPVPGRSWLFGRMEKRAPKPNANTPRQRAGGTTHAQTDPREEGRRLGGHRMKEHTAAPLSPANHPPLVCDSPLPLARLRN